MKTVKAGMRDDFRMLRWRNSVSSANRAVMLRRAAAIEARRDDASVTTLARSRRRLHRAGEESHDVSLHPGEAELRERRRQERQRDDVDYPAASLVSPRCKAA
jgi:hypothetical protein